MGHVRVGKNMTQLSRSSFLSKKAHKPMGVEQRLKAALRANIKRRKVSKSDRELKK